LTLSEPRHEDDPAVGKLERVTMRVRLAGIDPSKPGKPFALHAKPEARQERSEGMDGLDLALEDEFSAREEADCHSRLAHRAKARVSVPGNRAEINRSPALAARDLTA
jgi:hypothetical protein